jgi:hypothetical protein
MGVGLASIYRHTTRELRERVKYGNETFILKMQRCRKCFAVSASESPRDIDFNAILRRPLKQIGVRLSSAPFLTL